MALAFRCLSKVSAGGNRTLSLISGTVELLLATIISCTPCSFAPPAGTPTKTALPPDVPRTGAECDGLYTGLHRRTGRGGEGGCSPPKVWATQIFGQREEIWAKPVFKGSLHVHLIILKS